MNIGTIITLAFVAAIVVAAVHNIIKNKKNGGCSCGCDGCCNKSGCCGK